MFSASKACRACGRLTDRYRDVCVPCQRGVRYDGAGRRPVTDGPFAETKDLIAGWMVIDVASYERAVELSGE